MIGKTHLVDNRVFVSCSFADRDRGREIARDILRQGWLCAMADDDSMHLGTELARTIEDQIAGSNVYLILVSSSSTQSRWARWEMSEIIKQTWRDHRKHVFLFILDDTEVPGAFSECPSLRFMDRDPRWLSNLRSSTTAGIKRGADGTERLARRLTEVERAAADLAEPDPSE